MRLRFIIVMLLILNLFLYGCANVNKTATAYDTLKKQHFIVHANGRLVEDDYIFDGSCSEEAFDLWYNKGYRVFEIDFNFTSDGDLACIHHWDRQYACIITENQPLSSDEFMNCRIFYRYTPMNLKSVAEKLEKDPDLYFITDIKDDNVRGAKLIAERYPHLLDQFILQIYDYNQYSAINDLGFKNIILTVYALPSYEMKADAETIAEFSRQNKLFGIAFPYEFIEWKGYLDTLKTSGVPLFVHTVNDSNQQKYYLDLGITAIFADKPSTLN